jgi:hypothetical protein
MTERIPATVTQSCNHPRRDQAVRGEPPARTRQPLTVESQSIKCRRRRFCIKEDVRLRFLPDIRYGTENYPEKVARRLRAVNLAAWSAAAVAALGLANYVALEFLNPKPGLWKVGVVLALAASIWASVPLLHRFGTLWGALIAFKCCSETFSTPASPEVSGWSFWLGRRRRLPFSGRRRWSKLTEWLASKTRGE